LGITVNNQDLGQGAVLGQAITRSFEESYPVIGVHATALNSYREAIFPVQSGPVKTPWQLEVRVFDDGVAMRYRVPGAGQRRLNGEATGWKLPPGSVTWAQSSTDVYERPYLEQTVDALAPDATIAAPLVAKLPGGTGYAFVSEANTVGYSDMALRVGSGGALSAVFDKDPQGWTTEGEIVSSWRVTLLAPDLTALVNSDILRNLCPPPAPGLQNAAWFKPGRSTWHWMVTGRPQLGVQTRWVDWTKQLGFEYYLIDDGWRVWRDGDRDAWACLKGVVDYARTRDVAIWAWVHSREVFKPEDRLVYFQKAKSIGLGGLKIDFPQRPNVAWVNWYDDTLRDAAKYQLMIDFHGAVKPSGRDRTWPNELTREAILGRESGKLPALHDTALPFTRYVQGHADYTPTDFRPGKLGGSSWTRELAQAIVYTSPFLCYGGSPEDYLAHPALDVLKSIPATWDETRVLPDSEIGRTAAFARRSGHDWFVGVVNGNEARPFRINLDFLGKGRFRADSLADSSEKNDAFVRTWRVVSSRDNLTFGLRRDGGFVARFSRITR
jgi:alpha-glucosidase